MEKLKSSLRFYLRTGTDSMRLGEKIIRKNPPFDNTQGPPFPAWFDCVIPELVEGLTTGQRDRRQAQGTPFPALAGLSDHQYCSSVYSQQGSRL